MDQLGPNCPMLTQIDNFCKQFPLFTIICVIFTHMARCSKLTTSLTLSGSPCPGLVQDKKKVNRISKLSSAWAQKEVGFLSYAWL